MKTLNFLFVYNEYIQNIYDLSLIEDNDIYINFKKQKLVEGLIKTHPNIDSLKIILKRFPNLTGEIEIDGEIYLQGLFSKIEDYLPLFNNLGYFISKYTLDGDIWISNIKYSDKPLALFLEAKYDMKISPLPNKLYHATYSKNINRILKYGLIPKSNSKLSNHPDRIYLTDNLEIAKNFTKYLGDESIILEIDTKNLSIILYKDVNLPDNGFYTLDNISPKNIKKIN